MKIYKILFRLLQVKLRIGLKLMYELNIYVDCYTKTIEKIYEKEQWHGVIFIMIVFFCLKHYPVSLHNF